MAQRFKSFQIFQKSWVDSGKVLGNRAGGISQFEVSNLEFKLQLSFPTPYKLF